MSVKASILVLEHSPLSTNNSALPGSKIAPRPNIDAVTINNHTHTKF